MKPGLNMKYFSPNACPNLGRLVTFVDSAIDSAQQSWKLAEIKVVSLDVLTRKLRKGTLNAGESWKF